MPERLSRRSFIKGAALAGVSVAIPVIIPSSALGKNGKAAPSNRIALGFIGVGGMGTANLSAFSSYPDVEVLAVCDVHATRLDIAKERVGDSCAAYADFRKLLEHKGLDAVVISTPDHWHTPISIMALRAGMDIYCEKPLTYSIAEGRMLVNTTRQFGRVFQVGSQQRSDPNFRYVCELVLNGKIGKLKEIKVGIGGGPRGGDTRITEPPDELDWEMYVGPAVMTPFQKDRYGYNFRWFSEYSGGSVTDWGAHHNDIAQWGTGNSLTGPVKVEGTGEFPTSGAYDVVSNFSFTYTYKNGLPVNCSNGNRHGVTFIGEDGWVWVDRGSRESNIPDLFNSKFTDKDTHLYESPGHHRDFLNCIKNRKKPICDVEIGVRSVTICHLGNIVARLGRPLKWNPDTEQFVDDAEANRWLFRPYRGKWAKEAM